MIDYRIGGRRGTRYTLAEAPDMVVVRTRRRRPLADVSLAPRSRTALSGFETVMRFRHAGVEVLRGARADAARARKLWKQDGECEFAGRVLCDPRSKSPIIYTENLFVKFEDDCSAAECRRILARRKLTVKRALPYARNAFFVEAKAGTGRAVFEHAAALFRNEAVELCHPELVRELRRRGAFPQQWHLKRATIGGAAIDQHVDVEGAWTHSRGAGIVVAIIDDGFDLEHEEISSSAKVVAPRDVSRGNDDPRPGAGDDHGTACMGVACADGRFGASGVAPEARLMPIRSKAGLGSQREADAFFWAAQHGADVISCSWGATDGRWWDPNDPRHQQVVPLFDSTRLGIDWATRNGRNGKGCVITFAAGNGNESVDNDGYASYAKVIAVAACNDSGKRSVYSDFGNAVWCSFPSSDLSAPGHAPRTPGIWTTDRTGAAGYNPGRLENGDAAGKYANDFGGTSSACPGAAGVAALVLARNPQLRWDEVKDVLKRSCDRIDTAGGQYDATGHSRFYGFGRLNARRAVELAVPVSQPAPSPGATPAAGGAPMPPAAAVAARTVTVSVAEDVPIRDFAKARSTVEVAGAGALGALVVGVDLEHTYIGDLVVRLVPPSATGVAPIVLHDRQGGGTDDLKATFDAIARPALASLAGKPFAGTWTLEVEDFAAADTGTLRGFSLRFTGVAGTPRRAKARRRGAKGAKGARRSARRPAARRRSFARASR